MRSLLFSVLLVSLAFLGATWLILRPCLAADFIRRIVGIIDGDTLEVLHNQHPERIRLGGIDCPEECQACGTRAKPVSSELVSRKVGPLQTHDVDQYGYTIVDVMLLHLNRGRSTP